MWHGEKSSQEHRLLEEVIPGGRDGKGDDALCLQAAAQGRVTIELDLRYEVCDICRVLQVVSCCFRVHEANADPCTTQGTLTHM